MNQFHAFIMMKKVSLICNLCGSEIPVPGLKNHTDQCKSKDQIGNRMENGNLDVEQNMPKGRLQILLEYGEQFAKQLRENSEREKPRIDWFSSELTDWL